MIGWTVPLFGIHVLGGTVHPLQSPSQVDNVLRLKLDAQNHEQLTSSLRSYRAVSMIYEFPSFVPNGALFKYNTTDANNRRHYARGGGKRKDRNSVDQGLFHD
jgi:hypothetical protein